MKVAQIAIVFGLIGCLTNSVARQLSSTAYVYRSQYSDLKSKTLSLLDRAADSRSNARSLHEEQLALLKLVHRLEEQVMADNIERAALGQASDKGLLLVAQACKALDFALAATDKYVDIGDRSFVELARQGIALADPVERLF